MVFSRPRFFLSYTKPNARRSWQPLRSAQCYEKLLSSSCPFSSADLFMFLWLKHSCPLRNALGRKDGNLIILRNEEILKKNDWPSIGWGTAKRSWRLYENQFQNSMHNSRSHLSTLFLLNFKLGFVWSFKMFCPHTKAYFVAILHGHWWAVFVLM